MRKRKEQAPRPQPRTAIGPDLVFVRGDTFTMGSKTENPNASVDEKPCHQVQVSSFYMSKYELTYAEFKTFVNETGYQTDAEKGNGSITYTGGTWEKKTGINWRHDAQGKLRNPNEKRHPVIHVSWNDAQAYIQWLNGKTGKSYRLPTEAEWEYAARGGQKSQGYVYRGSNDINAVAWYGQNSGNRTHPIGEKQANELGLFDMTGNVWEWCQDWYDASYYAGRPELDVSPQGPPMGEKRVRRGGSWSDNQADSRVTYRFRFSPDNRRNTLGME